MIMIFAEERRGFGVLLGVGVVVRGI